MYEISRVRANKLHYFPISISGNARNIYCTNDQGRIRSNSNPLNEAKVHNRLMLKCDGWCSKFKCQFHSSLVASVLKPIQYTIADFDILQSQSRECNCRTPVHNQLFFYKHHVQNTLVTARVISRVSEAQITL